MADLWTQKQQTRATAGLILFEVLGQVMWPIIGGGRDSVFRAAVAGCVLGDVWICGRDGAAWGAYGAGDICVGYCAADCVFSVEGDGDEVYVCV